VVLLADIFENFRNICLSTYNLDPAFYYTVPGLSFDAMLKLTSKKLQLLSDYDMILMIEKGIIYYYLLIIFYCLIKYIIIEGIRGGLTQASMRYAKANNYKTADYDNKKPESWIIYQDCKYIK